MKSIGKREYDEEQVMRLGRSLRRISRSTKDLMRFLDIDEEDVRIPRKKRRPARTKIPASSSESE